LSMGKFQIIDVDLFMVFLLIIIIGIIRIKGTYISNSTALFLLLAWSTVIVLIADMASWLSDGYRGPGSSYTLTYMAAFFLYFLEPLPLMFWLCYLDFQLHGSMERIRSRFYYILPFIISTGVMIYSLFTDFAFTVDDYNNYHRERGMYLVVLIHMGMIVSSFILFIKAREQVNRRVFHTTVLFGGLPVIGMALQSVFYGTCLIWPSVALSVAFTYIYLETQKEIRDSLTGLINRQQFIDVLQARIGEYDRRGGFALLMVDMDHFKSINDNYGHKEGDRALERVSCLLGGKVKGIDRLARYGGDEFMIILETDRDDRVGTIIGRIEDTIGEENRFSSAPYPISLSIGYSLYEPRRHSSLGELIHEADMAMYAAKSRKHGNKTLP